MWGFGTRCHGDADMAGDVVPGQAYVALVPGGGHITFNITFEAPADAVPGGAKGALWP